MNFKKLVVTAAAVIVSASAFAQNDVRNWREADYDYWFVGAGAGLNIGFNGNVFQDKFYRNLSERGPGFCMDVYAGKWLGRFVGLRAGWQGLTISDEYTTFGEYKYSYVHGDVLFRPWKAVVPYVHLGAVSIEKKSSFGAGAGIMFPIPVSKTISIVPDFKYTGFKSNVFPTGASIASNFSATLGIAIKFGGTRRRTVEIPEEPIYIPEPPITVHDTVYVNVKTTPDTVVVKEIIVDHEKKAAEINEYLRNTTLFDFDSFNLTAEARRGLDEVVAWMNKYPQVNAILEGHTDNRGSDSYNQKLSENRARAVRDYIESHGISADRLSYVGYGKTRPYTTNDTEEGRHQNRRVEVHFFEKK